MLCVLILVFIFLTPKGWFSTSERVRAEEHPKEVSTLIVDAEVIDNKADRAEIQRRIRALTGRPEIEVLNVRKSFDNEGKPRGYEVDIR